jgi:hypothetical protein
MMGLGGTGTILVECFMGTGNNCRGYGQTLSDYGVMRGSAALLKKGYSSGLGSVGELGLSGVSV